MNSKSSILSKRIGVLSDTHSTLHPRIFEHFSQCDEIWHAGDIGCLNTSDQLLNFKQLIAVHGNIDGNDVRLTFPRVQVFESAGLKVLMTHISGYPGKYEAGVESLIRIHRPDILVGGHSHILKVVRDKYYNLLHINPGACGNYGFQKVKTIVRFEIDKGSLTNMEVIELASNK